MDIVFIKELQINTIIGIYDWERQIRQTVSLDAAAESLGRPGDLHVAGVTVIDRFQGE